MFENARDVHYFMCPDVVNDLTVENVTRETVYDAVLGCRDRAIRVVVVGVDWRGKRMRVCTHAHTRPPPPFSAG